MIEYNKFDFKKISHILEDLKLKENNINVAIHLHDNPDPDAISSGFAMQFILKYIFNLKSDIYYGGEVSHPQNKTIVKIFEIEMLNRNKYIKENYVFNILLDVSFPGCKNMRSGNTNIEPNIVIDHHKDSRIETEIAKDYVCIVNIGSTATIITILLEQTIGLINNESEIFKEEFKDICTALLIGIKTDTNDLTSISTTNTDMEAYLYLYQNCNKNKKIKIESYPLPISFLDIYEIGFKNRQIEVSTIATYLGIITSKNRDAMPIISDILLRTESIDTVVVMAIEKSVDGYKLIASVRCDNDTTDLENLVREVFGNEYSGAKKSAGGAQIPIISKDCSLLLECINNNEDLNINEIFKKLIDMEIQKFFKIRNI